MKDLREELHTILETIGVAGPSKNGSFEGSREKTSAVLMDLLEGLQGLTERYVRTAEEEAARIRKAVSDEAEAVILDAKNQALAETKGAREIAVRTQNETQAKAEKVLENAHRTAKGIREAAERDAAQLQSTTEARLSELLEQMERRRARLEEKNATLTTRIAQLSDALRKLDIDIGPPSGPTHVGPEPSAIEADPLGDLLPLPSEEVGEDAADAASEAEREPELDIWSPAENEGQPKPFPAPRR